MLFIALGVVLFICGMLLVAGMFIFDMLLLAGIIFDIPLVAGISVVSIVPLVLLILELGDGISVELLGLF